LALRKIALCVSPPPPPPLAPPPPQFSPIEGCLDWFRPQTLPGFPFLFAISPPGFFPFLMRASFEQLFFFLLSKSRVLRAFFFYVLGFPMVSSLSHLFLADTFYSDLPASRKTLFLRARLRWGFEPLRNPPFLPTVSVFFLWPLPVGSCSPSAFFFCDDFRFPQECC